MDTIEEQIIENVRYSRKNCYDECELGNYIPKDSKHHITQTNMHVPVTRQGKEYKIAATLYAIDQAAPCVVYMHGNGCDRSEGCMMVENITSLHCHLFIFDYVGNGLSEGDFLSGGYYERDDVYVLICELSKRKDISNYILWGRSFGASVALMYMNKYQSKNVIGIISDSGSTHKILAIKEKISLFNTSMCEDDKLKMAESICNTLLTKYQINFKDIIVIDGVGKLQAPILIIYGNSDVLVLPHHSIDLFNAYGCKDKKIVSFEGGHNDFKPRHIHEEITSFIKRIANQK